MPPATASPPRLIGGSPELYDRFWANVRAGVVNWNKPTNGAPSNAPFGGIGLSRQPPARAPITPPIIAPIRSPAPKPRAPRATIGVGLADPNAASATNLEG